METFLGEASRRGIPQHLQSKLYHKLKNEVFDAGETLFIALVERDECTDDPSEAGEGEEAGGETEDRTAPSSRKVVVRDDYVRDGVQDAEESDIFLVDHAWTFQPGSAREQLRSSEPLLRRMAALMQVPEMGENDCVGGKPEENEEGDGGDGASDSEGDDGVSHREGGGENERARVLEGVLSALPTFSRRYGLGRAGLHVSYVNDELGSAFRHSESPNCQMSLFMFTDVDRGGGVMAYSVLWPLRPLQPSEEATLDLLRSTAWSGATSAGARQSFVRGLSLPCSLGRIPQHGLPAGGSTDESLSMPRDRLAKRQRRMDSWAAEHQARCATATATASRKSIAAEAPPPPPPGRQQTFNDNDNGATPTLVDGAAPPVLADDSQQPPCSAGASRSPIASGPRADGGSGRREKGSPLSVWTDLPHLSDGETGLTRPEFVVLDCGVGASSPRDADVVWASSSIDRKFEAAMGGLRPEQMVNQFPYEAALVVKSHLARTIQREFGSGSPEGDAMQPTFDMQSEDDALAFVGEFRRRRDAGTNNIWIVKPIGLARSMDMTVTGSLGTVLRAADTGPKVAQLYLSQPLLWRRRKFDLRVVALLVSAHPLELYVHDCYWPRVAERPHQVEPREADATVQGQEQQQRGDVVPLSLLEDPRVSLTATHLLQGGGAVEGGGGGVACHPHYEDFAREMQDVVSQRRPGSTWDGVLAKTRAMILSVFTAAARQQPGLDCPRARAMYGCDVMVTEGLEPRLLEVTFCPGNLAASPAWPVQQPDFLNEAFGCLFLGERNNVTRLA